MPSSAYPKSNVHRMKTISASFSCKGLQGYASSETSAHQFHAELLPLANVPGSPLFLDAVTFVGPLAGRLEGTKATCRSLPGPSACASPWRTRFLGSCPELGLRLRTCSSKSPRGSKYPILSYSSVGTRNLKYWVSGPSAINNTSRRKDSGCTESYRSAHEDPSCRKASS